MSREHPPIKIESAALDEKGGRLILRGVVAVESLPHLLVDDYQREVLSPKQRESIADALMHNNPLPDITLGMRGDKHSVRNGVFYLNDPTFLIDGLQRRETIMEFLSGNPEGSVRIGALVYLNSDKAFEKELFHVLNARRLKIAPSILLRNARDSNTGALMLWGLTTSERQFIMHKKVCWQQTRARGELVTALMFAKVALMLHAHKVIPPSRGGVDEVLAALNALVESVGVQTIRENLRTFWGLVDECWGIARVRYHDKAPFLKGTFLEIMAKLLSDHYDFWEGDDERKLAVEASLRRKFHKFPVSDPAVTQLAGSAGKSQEMLYMMMRDHINSGKRHRRLKSRHGDAVILKPGDDEDTEVADAA